VGNWIGLRDWSLLPLSIASAIGGQVPRGATYHAQTSARDTSGSVGAKPS